MASGIVIVDKPADWTSQDVAAKLRGVFHQRRVGHGGTLDPMATGVLPVFVGRATRAVEFFESAEKEYVAGLRLGVVTDTQDVTGRVLEERPAAVDAAAVAAVLPRFLGPQLQVPPMYSAVKVHGQKLYQLARQGREVERKPRRIHIFELELLEGGGCDWRLRIRCSPGTYVRTLCHDIGQALGCGGAMYSLRRTQAAGFTLQDAVTLAAVQAAEDPIALLRPVDAYFARYPALTLPSAQAEKKVRNGTPLSLTGEDGVYRVYSQEGAFLALSRLAQGTLTTIKSFFEV